MVTTYQLTTLVTTATALAPTAGRLTPIQVVQETLATLALTLTTVVAELLETQVQTLLL